MSFDDYGRVKMRSYVCHNLERSETGTRRESLLSPLLYHNTLFSFFTQILSNDINKTPIVSNNKSTVVTDLFEPSFLIPLTHLSHSESVTSNSLLLTSLYSRSSNSAVFIAITIRLTGAILDNSRSLKAIFLVKTMRSNTKRWRFKLDNCSIRRFVFKKIESRCADA